MDDQLRLAVLALLALAFELQAVKNLAPVSWAQPESRVVALCASVDVNTGCPPVDQKWAYHGQ